MTSSATQTPVDAIAERFRPRIERYVERMVRSDADAEDLVQETFLRVARGLAAFRAEAAVSTWVYRIATNVCLDFLRRRATRPETISASGEEPLEAAPDLAPGDPCGGPVLAPDALFESSEMGRCIRGYLDSLPEAQRAALVLRDLEGLTNAEAAEVLGWSLERTKINVHRARGRLRELLERECLFYRDERNVLCCDRRPPGDGAEGCG